MTPLEETMRAAYILSHKLGVASLMEATQKLWIDEQLTVVLLRITEAEHILNTAIPALETLPH